MDQTNLISIDELIKAAKKAGVGFGKIDPYNRLRYYTKMSLLPHMERRKAKNGQIKAYYPAGTVQKLLTIEKLKAQGLTNDQILSELNKRTHTLKDMLRSKLTRPAVLLIIGALVLGVTYLMPNLVANLTQTYAESTASALSSDSTFAARIQQSGTATLKAGKKSTFVQASKLTEGSDIQVAFRDPLTPASTYSITAKVSGEGFILTADNQPAKDASFFWWVLEN